MIFEAVRKVDYETLAEFEKDILDNPLKLAKTVVSGWYIVTYTGCGPDAPELYFNAANTEIPMGAGKSINYSPAKVFDSPYMQADYNSGIVTVRKGAEELVLDFVTNAHGN